MVTTQWVPLPSGNEIVENVGGIDGNQEVCLIAKDAVRQIHHFVGFGRLGSYPGQVNAQVPSIFAQDVSVPYVAHSSPASRIGHWQFVLSTPAARIILLLMIGTYTTSSTSLLPTRNVVTPGGRGDPMQDPRCAYLPNPGLDPKHGTNN